MRERFTHIRTTVTTAVDGTDHMTSVELGRFVTDESDGYRKWQHVKWLPGHSSHYIGTREVESDDA